MGRTARERRPRVRENREVAAPSIAADIRDEAAAIGAAAVEAGLPLRLMGGLAIFVACPTVRQAPLARSYPDVDLAGEARSASAIADFLAARGYVPERLFNAIHGAQRLNFAHPDGRWTIDVLLDELRMSHAVAFRGRLATDGPTIDLADLLLTKLQVWEINHKDLGDAAAILADHALVRGRGRPSVQAVDVDRIAGLTGSDWGLDHTVARNLGRLAAFLAETRLAATPFDAAAAVEALRRAVLDAPKTLGWRARARVGERVRWYETPEEVRH
jgi:hypothetical protein